MHITEIALLTDDMPGTEHFYNEILGLTITQKTTGSVSFSVGHSLLTFTESEQVRPQYHFAFNIPHNQLDDAIAWTASKFELLPVEETGVIADFKNWNAKSIYFHDNNGNILEFIARFDLQNACDQTFSGASIECISEMALVDDQPLQLADKLLKKNDVPFYAKGPKEENFAVMGNDEGLLILSQTGRSWYPTNTPSKKFHMKIKFFTENEKGERTESELSFNTGY